MSAVVPVGVRIVTYNVLSSHLCEPSHFPKCNPDFLDPTYRYTKLEDKLLMEIDNGAIICLQEVSSEWAGYLYSFFAEHNYALITGLYGYQKNGYMGVATAVPLNLYKLQSVSIDTLSDFIPEELLSPKKPWTRDTKKEETIFTVFAAFLDCFKMLVRIVCSLLCCGCEDKKEKAPQDTSFDMARGRNNQMVTVTLVPRNAQASATTTVKGRRKSSASKSPTGFVVANYHMPCMFKQPKVMMIHSSLAALITRKHATMSVGNKTKVVPHILAGDFNMKPVSGMYSGLVTSRDASGAGAPVSDGVDCIPPQFDKFLTLFYSEQGLHHDGSENQVDVIKSDLKFYSLYREVNGQEPDFTNYATSMTWGTDTPVEFSFIDTLDYVFVSTDGWEPMDRVADSVLTPTAATATASASASASATPSKSRRKSVKSAVAEDAMTLSPADMNKHHLIPVHHRDAVTEPTAAAYNTDSGIFGPYPSRDEHSDHIMIGGTLYLQQ